MDYFYFKAVERIMQGVPCIGPGQQTFLGEKKLPKTYLPQQEFDLN